MYVCICKGVTEVDVRRAGQTGITDPDALIAVLGLDEDVCCGRCAESIQKLVELARSAKSPPCTAAAESRLSR
jgi:bacterioferritin-associated ferredoxin